MNWHPVEEKPQYDKLCVLKIANSQTTTIDYVIGRFKTNWVDKTCKRIHRHVVQWAYINEPKP